MATSQKKFTVKPFTQRKGLDTLEASKTWAVLEAGILQIYQKKESELSFEEHYRHCYNLVLNKHGDMLYNSLSELVKTQLKTSIQELIATSDESLLKKLSCTWNDHRVIFSVLKDVLMYMDRSYVAQHRKHPVFTMCVLVFRNELVYHIQLRERIRGLLLAVVESERQGFVVDRALIKEVLCMLGDLSLDGVNVYEEDFERHFLTASRVYYRQEASQYLSKGNCSEYLIKAETRLNEETGRARAYLSSSTEIKLKNLLEFEYITTNAKPLVDMEGNGAVPMIIEDRVVELKRMYRLFSLTPSTLEFLRDAMGNYIKQHGLEIVFDQETIKDPVHFVQQMIDFKQKLDSIIKESFRDDKLFHKKLKDSFESFVNNDTKSASYVASYVDDILKSGGSKGMSESEVEQQLDRAMTIFKYLQDKDIFEHMYRAHFSKRLLNNKSISDDLERVMITKLKNECGQQFTSKLEGMFLDMHLAKQIMDDFHNSSLHSRCGFDLEVQTFTASHWAMKPVPACVLPAVVNQGCDLFNQFYLDRFKTGRRLTWLTHVGTADIKATFASGKHELNVSTYQMCMLMLFNDRSTLSLEQIRHEIPGIPEIELRRHLLSLCTPKLRILKKSSTSKAIEDDDVITFNHEFTSKYKRIKVPLISAKEVTVEELEAVSSSVEEDRRHLVEAAIVRIMKSRRRLSHADLLAETTRQLAARFQPTPLFIKKRIESLIEREYLQRDKDDSRFYNYLA